MSHHHLEELCSGQDDRILLYIRWNYARLVVYLDHCPSSLVVENLLNVGYIARVMVDGKEMCLKAGDSKGEDVAQRELDCLCD
jgi:PleD family two-component response regulator